MDSCKVCGRKCKNKGFVTIGGQRACSINCAVNVVPLENDKCSQCGAPVWINDVHKINGLMCCSLACKEKVEQQTKNSSKKKMKKKKSKSDFLETYQQNDFENNSQNDNGYSEDKKFDFNDESEEKKNDSINIINTSKNNNNFNFPNFNIGPTNYALGPRDYNTNDYDVGPGDKTGNLYHGDSNYKFSNYSNNIRNNYTNNYNKAYNSDFNNNNNYNNNYTNNNNNYNNNYDFSNNYNNNYNEDYDEEDEAYGDYDDSNYLREYGEHNYVQKNDGKSGDHIRELGIKLKDSKDKPKNEVREIIHQGNDINCEYCGFSIKSGSTAFVDNYGKVFDTNECFSNHFQGIPKPNFG